MKVKVVCVGKLKEAYWKEAIAEYAKRLKPYLNVTVVEVPDRDPAKFSSEADAIAREGDDILKSLSERDYVILLAIEGKELSSTDISKRLDKLGVEGISQIAFCIGGSCGVDERVRQRADEQWSFGPITLPHNLARVVLFEQMYRACRISRGEPYHK